MSDLSCDCHEPTATISVRGIKFDIDAKDLPKCECRPGGEVQIPEGSVLLKKLSADLDLFVAPDGDDANDGLSAATPLKTIAAALEKTTAYARSVYTITINLASGSYPEFVNVDFTGHYPKLVIKGNDSLPVIGDGVNARMYGYLKLEQVHVRQVTKKKVVWGYDHATVCLRNCRVAANSGTDTYVIIGTNCAFIHISGTLSVSTSGTVGYIFFTGVNSCMLLDSDAAVSLSASVISGTFNVALWSGVNVYYGATISGSVTGKRYQIGGASSLLVPSSSPATFIPGTLAGTVGTGSVYTGY